MGLRISEQEYQKKVEDISHMVVRDVLDSKYSELINQSSMSECNIGQLYSIIKRQITQKVLNCVKKERLIKTGYKWQSCTVSNGLYRMRDIDIDEVDIEYRYCNVDRLLPNLYNDIKQGVEQIIQMKNSNV